ncbi:MAG: biopolymer transporter ExbD [Saprospiraceae bacterium]|jgi:biopolymer transport protein ExbD|nr:biopolymer transporter ExbD [Saprospiraceae bacterium]
MGLKKKNKVSAEFSMSSLTDIIFLLLIFFMLTSSVVTPNALNLKMPGNSSSSVTVSEKPDDVTITRKGTLRVNGKTVSKGQLDRKLNDIRRKKGRKVSMTISPKKGAPTESVVLVMDAMRRLGINGILAMEED